MTYKKVMALSNKFIIKLANDRFTNRESDAFFTDKESDTMIDLDLPTFDETPETATGVKKPISTKKMVPIIDSDRVTAPKGPIPTQKLIAYEIADLLKDAFAAFEQDMTSLKFQNFYKDESVSFADRNFIHKFAGKLSENLKLCNNLPLDDLKKILETFTVFISENAGSIIKTNNILNDFLVTKKKRAKPIGMLEIIKTYKTFREDFRFHEIYLEMNDTPDSFNELLAQQIKTANTIFCRKLMLLKFGCIL